MNATAYSILPHLHCLAYTPRPGLPFTEKRSFFPLRKLLRTKHIVQYRFFQRNVPKRQAMPLLKNLRPFGRRCSKTFSEVVFEQRL